MVRSLVSLLLLLAAAPAWGDTVCLASDVALAPTRTSGSVGELERRSCFAVQERKEGAIQVWVTGRDGLQADVDVPSSALAYTLVDDVELREEPDGPTFGRILSGRVVSVVSERADGSWLVEPVEGRLRPRFRVMQTDLFPASSWPSPDPDDVADPPWPAADQPLPPVATELAPAEGAQPTVLVDVPIYDPADMALDPGFGSLKWAELERSEFAVKVRVVSPTLWVEGWTRSVDWRDPMPAAGWKLSPGAPSSSASTVLPRQVADKPAPLSAEPKGDAFGELLPGTRVTVQQEEKGWVQVLAAFEHGTATGWVSKKALVKEGQEAAASPVPSTHALLEFGNTAVLWADETGHTGDQEAGTEPHAVGLTPDPLTAAISRASDPLRRAYGLQLASNPGLAGEITLKARVGADGVPSELAVAKDTLQAPELTEQLLAALQGLTFPEREIPRKKRRTDPDLDWQVDVWVQLLFAPRR